MSILPFSVRIPVEVFGLQSFSNSWDFIHRRETQHRHSWLLPYVGAFFEVGFPSPGKANCRSFWCSDLCNVISGGLAVFKGVEIQNRNRIGMGIRSSPGNDQHSRRACISSTGESNRCQQGKGRSGLQVVLHQIGVTSR